MQPKRQIGFGDFQWPKGLDKYIRQIKESRRLTYGPICKKLEEKFCKINGVAHAVFCSSGTAALYTALGVLKNLHPEEAKKRPYIILPATTFVSDPNVVLLHGFQPLFVDVTNKYNISYSGLETALKNNVSRVFAVMPSSLMGRPVDGLKIKTLTNDYSPGTFIILDSCENICSKYDNQYPESFADFTAWSFYLSHLLIAGAVGGMIGTNDPKLAIQARSYINHGRWSGYTNIDDDNNVDEATLRDITAKRFQFVQVGTNCRLGEIEAAFALAMLEDDFMGQLEKRKKNAEFLIKELSKFDLILPTFTEKEEARHMMLPIRLPRGNKTDLINHLEKNGIETRDILPLGNQPILKQYFGNPIQFKTHFPVSAEILENGFYISCTQYLTQEDLDYMVKVFEDLFKK